jgi:hypothetical protein
MQENWPGFEKFIRWLYAFQCAQRLNWILWRMDIPTGRRKTRELHQLLWLRRNVHINNGDNPHLQEVSDLIKRLLWNSAFMDLHNIEDLVYEIVAEAELSTTPDSGS